ncbi:MAG: hypothetical protein KF773_39060 [Deltaproteobacteria bacterium]|nr:hypothetical protein [Deltaproteobacteria bacterium]
MTRALVLATLVAAASCKPGDAAPACGAVAGNFILIATRDIDAAKVDGDTRRAVREQLPAMRDALDHACSDNAWSQGVRTCLFEARDSRTFQACETQLTEAQRRELERLEAGKKSE